MEKEGNSEERMIPHILHSQQMVQFFQIENPTGQNLDVGSLLEYHSLDLRFYTNLKNLRAGVWIKSEGVVMKSERAQKRGFISSFVSQT